MGGLIGLDGQVDSGTQGWLLFFRLDVLSLVCMVDCSVIIEERFFFLARLVVPGSSSR